LHFKFWRKELLTYPVFVLVLCSSAMGGPGPSHSQTTRQPPQPTPTKHLSLDSIAVNGHQYNIETESFDQASTGKGKRTAGMVVGDTGAGAAIGGLAGGGKGAAIGALVGAGAGTIGAATGNRDITLPVESALSFGLVQPLTLKPDVQ
jgi:hypothetical protein